MKTKHLILAALALVLTRFAYPAVMGPVCSAEALATKELGEDEKGSKKVCGLSPCFHPTNNNIMLAARRWVRGEDAGSPRCGYFTLKPLKGDVRIQAAQMKYNIWSKNWEPGKIVSWDGKSSWVKIPAVGKKVYFGRPGWGCRHYWTLNCTTQMVGTPQLEDCKNLVEIKSVEFPVRCRLFKGKYKPLNLYAKAGEQSPE